MHPGCLSSQANNSFHKGKWDSRPRLLVCLVEQKTWLDAGFCRTGLKTTTAGGSNWKPPTHLVTVLSGSLSVKWPRWHSQYLTPMCKISSQSESQDHQGFEKPRCPRSSLRNVCTLWFQSWTWYLTPNGVGVQSTLGSLKPSLFYTFNGSIYPVFLHNLFRSCGDLCPDSPAHLSRQRCEGNRRSLWRRGGCPSPLEYERECLSFHTPPHQSPSTPADHNNRRAGNGPNWATALSLDRTCCCWATSTQAAATWRAPNGSTSASSPTRASAGWSPMRPTPW